MSLFTINLVLLSAVVHAGWNLIIRSHNLSTRMIRVPLLLTAIGAGPLFWLEWSIGSLPGSVWMLLLAAGTFQSTYYWGLAMGYQSGDFTVVYPLVRALPVFFIAIFDLARGHVPSTLAWLGLCCVTVGCLLIPHTSVRALRWQSYRSFTLVWVVIAALSTVGYTAVDKVAAEWMVAGPVNAARYFVLELAFCLIPFALLLRFTGQPLGIRPLKSGWFWPLLAGLGTFFSYWLILWAYQSATHASYVVAMRQLSIVLGAIAGAVLFQEPARGLRIPAAGLITAGIILIALGG